MADRVPSKVQAVAFPTDSWTEAAAKAWLKAHGFRVGRLERSQNFLRFTQHDSAGFSSFGTVPQETDFRGKVRPFQFVIGGHRGEFKAAVAKAKSRRRGNAGHRFPVGALVYVQSAWAPPTRARVVGHGPALWYQVQPLAPRTGAAVGDPVELSEGSLSATRSGRGSTTTAGIVVEFVERLLADAEAYHRGDIDHTELGRRNRRTWDAVDAQGVRRQVDAALRKALPSAPAGPRRKATNPRTPGAWKGKAGRKPRTKHPTLPRHVAQAATVLPGETPGGRRHWKAAQTGALSPSGLWAGDPMLVEDAGLRLEILREQPRPRLPHGPPVGTDVGAQRSARRSGRRRNLSTPEHVGKAKAAVAEARLATDRAAKAISRAVGGAGATAKREALSAASTAAHELGKAWAHWASAERPADLGNVIASAAVESFNMEQDLGRQINPSAAVIPGGRRKATARRPAKNPPIAFPPGPEARIPVDYRISPGAAMGDFRGRLDRWTRSEGVQTDIEGRQLDRWVVERDVLGSDLAGSELVRVTAPQHVHDDLRKVRGARVEATGAPVLRSAGPLLSSGATLSMFPVGAEGGPQLGLFNPGGSYVPDRKTAAIVAQSKRAWAVKLRAQAEHDPSRLGREYLIGLASTAEREAAAWEKSARTRSPLRVANPGLAPGDAIIRAWSGSGQTGTVRVQRSPDGEFYVASLYMGFNASPAMQDSRKRQRDAVSLAERFAYSTATFGITWLGPWEPDYAMYAAAARERLLHNPEPWTSVTSWTADLYQPGTRKIVGRLGLRRTPIGYSVDLMDRDRMRIMASDPHVPTIEAASAFGARYGRPGPWVEHGPVPSARRRNEQPLSELAQALFRIIRERTQGMTWDYLTRMTAQQILPGWPKVKDLDRAAKELELAGLIDRFFVSQGVPFPGWAYRLTPYGAKAPVPFAKAPA